MYSRTIDRENLRTWARILGILLFAVATAISARISIFTSLSPVPLTMQVLVVILSGFVLGSRDGLIAQPRSLCGAVPNKSSRHSGSRRAVTWRMPLSMVTH